MANDTKDVLGRIGRLRFCAWTLCIMLTLLAAVLCGVPLFVTIGPAAVILLPVLWLAFLLADAIICVRRLKDLDWPLWLVAGTVIPGVNVALVVVLAVLPGKVENNPHGPAPGRAQEWRGFLFATLVATAAVLGCLLVYSTQLPVTSDLPLW